MTLVGKIFTMLILIMSVLFMGFSIMVYATHVNWKVEAEAINAKYTVELETNKQKQAQIENLKSRIAMEQAARAFVLASLQTRLKETEDQLVARQKILENLRATETEKTAALDVALKQLEALKTEVDGLRVEIRDTQLDVDTQFASVVTLTDDINQARRTREQLEERQGPLLLQLASLEQMVSKMGVRFEVGSDGTVTSDIDRVPPPVDGVVLKVGEKDKVEISIGSDDGLLEGHELDVFRQDTYLGRMRVLRTAPDRAVCEVIPGYKRGRIKEGDRVATKLS